MPFTPRCSRFTTLMFGVTLACAWVTGTANAQTHTQHHKPARQAAVTGPKVSTLNGKFAFTLPQGYVANPMPPGDAQSGTAGSTGTMYSSEKSRRVVIATQVPTPKGIQAGMNDDAFLAKAASDYIEQQSKATPDFKSTGEKKLVLRKLGVTRIDSSATLGGGPTLSTTFIAGFGSTLSVVQVVSRADDQKGHATMVKRILAGR